MILITIPATEIAVEGRIDMQYVFVAVVFHFRYQIQKFLRLVDIVIYNDASLNHAVKIWQINIFLIYSLSSIIQYDRFVLEDYKLFSERIINQGVPAGYSNNGIIVTVFHDMQDYG